MGRIRSTQPDTTRLAEKSSLALACFFQLQYIYTTEESEIYKEKLENIATPPSHLN